MNINKLKLWGGLCLMFVFLPTTSEAYFTTNQNAMRISDQAVLYTITFEFGFSERDLYMPIMAKRNLTSQTELFSAGFELLDGSKSTDIGNLNGLIVSGDPDVEIRDTRYFVPAGESAKFTLLALLSIPSDQADPNLNASVQMTHLPFAMMVDGNEALNKLNPSELQYYITPRVKF